MRAGGPLLDSRELFDELITRLTAAGYAEDDIEWSENCAPPDSAEEFATEAIFVICNSGMKHTIAREIFNKCMQAIRAGESTSTVFGHKGKSGAIDAIWKDRQTWFENFLAAEDKVEFCKTIPWIGSITSYHLAKNFGAQVAKPDIHLVRLAERHATSPQELCEAISERTGYKVSTVDLILWRACAIGILDGHTCTLIEKVAPDARPQVPYQPELFELVQGELFSA